MPSDTAGSGNSPAWTSPPKTGREAKSHRIVIKSSGGLELRMVAQRPPAGRTTSSGRLQGCPEFMSERRRLSRKFWVSKVGRWYLLVVL
jgi:hypothetical protein